LGLLAVVGTKLILVEWNAMQVFFFVQENSRSVVVKGKHNLQFSFSLLDGLLSYWKSFALTI